MVGFDRFLTEKAMWRETVVVRGGFDRCSDGEHDRRRRKRCEEITRETIRNERKKIRFVQTLTRGVKPYLKNTSKNIKDR